MTLTRSKAWILAGSTAAAVLILGAWWWHGRAAPINAIMVQPFTGDPQLAEPMCDEVVDALARVHGLPIVKQPAEFPAVTGVLEGSVERSADRIRIVAQLRRFDGYRYWSRTFDRPIADLSLVHQDVAAAINSTSRPKKAPKNKPALPAYDAYLRGRYQFDHPENGGLGTAVTRFEEATRMDPTFAKAWAWLSIAKEYLADAGAVRPNLALPEARDAADRAEALDPDAAESNLAIGLVNLQYDWNWDDAKKQLDRAVQLSPGSAMAAYWRERWNQAMGHGPEPQFHFANLPPVNGDDDARKLLDNADDIRVETYISAAALALVANSIHDTESTFHWLDEAYAERCVQLPYIVWDPSLPRSDPRYLDLMRKMKLGGTE